jgi:hypothetical protein
MCRSSVRLEHTYRLAVAEVAKDARAALRVQKELDTFGLSSAQPGLFSS